MVLNWEAPQFFYPDMSCIQQNLEAELLGEFPQCVDSDYSNLPNNFLDPWCDPYNLLDIENHDIGMVQVQNFEPYPYPKRQKCSTGYYYPDFSNGFAPNPFLHPMVFATPVSKFQDPEVIDGTTRKPCGENVAKKIEEKSVSAQSIAARERRRKITEKTQELGKLVPGGNKMNTAEMLTAAFNYVKFLQAQLEILEFMVSFQEMKGSSPTEELHVVASPTVQEKLYLENNCLVPKEFVEILAKHFEARSKPSLSNQLNQLLKSSG